MQNHMTLNLISRSSVKVTHMGIGGMNYLDPKILESKTNSLLQHV